MNFILLAVSAVTWFLSVCQFISAVYHQVIAIHGYFYNVSFQVLLTDLSVLSVLRESDQPCLQRGSVIELMPHRSCCTQLYVQHVLFSTESCGNIYFVCVSERERERQTDEKVARVCHNMCWVTCALTGFSKPMLCLLVLMISLPWARKSVIGTEGKIARPMGEQSCYLHMKSYR